MATMDEKPLYGLERTVFRQLLHLFSRYADVIEKVILFGSRARGDYKEGSDIDLAIQFRKPGGPLYLLQSDLDELPIIYPIDVVDYNQIHNEQLKNEY